tara:strand:+ start:1979 stop:2260 length:282 start_codon:yes stop_codon:yes gene_type:complete
MAYGSNSGSKGMTRKPMKKKMEKKPAKPMDKGMKKKPTKAMKPRKLTPAEEKKLKEHSEHHSKAHMAKMRMVMTKEGKSFAAAHAIAKKKVGK